MTIDDGGPAFPGFGSVFTTDAQGRTASQSMWGMQGAEGMSLRDYFAVHVGEPGYEEITQEAGFVWRDGFVFHPDEDPETERGITFDRWWETLPNYERFRFNAIVRYKMADAMIARRKGP